MNLKKKKGKPNTEGSGKRIYQEMNTRTRVNSCNDINMIFFYSIVLRHFCKISSKEEKKNVFMKVFLV